MAPFMQPLFQSVGALIRSDFLYTERYLGDRHCGQRQFCVEPYQPGYDCFAWFFLQGLRNDVGLEKYQKVDTLMRMTIFAKNGFQIDIRAGSCTQRE